jgi:hypothetical protein
MLTAPLEGSVERNFCGRPAGQSLTSSAIGRMISTPSHVSMCSRLPVADLKAILRQANDAAFEAVHHRQNAVIKVVWRTDKATSQHDTDLFSNRSFQLPPS